ncbi:MAG: NADPH-dependent FMN reductase [Chitinophagaceae bacterium]
MPGSSASAVLKVASKLFPKYVDFTISEGLQTIPAFTDSNDVPPPLTKFIQLIAEADAVFLCTPEYAFGASGILKNAPDWTVSSIAFYDKPDALITAASFGDKAHAALTLTLTALVLKYLEKHPFSCQLCALN